MYCTLYGFSDIYNFFFFFRRNITKLDLMNENPMRGNEAQDIWIVICQLIISRFVSTHCTVSIANLVVMSVDWAKKKKTEEIVCSLCIRVECAAIYVLFMHVLAIVIISICYSMFVWHGVSTTGMTISFSQRRIYAKWRCVLEYTYYTYINSICICIGFGCSLPYTKSTHPHAPHIRNIFICI